MASNRNSKVVVPPDADAHDSSMAPDAARVALAVAALLLLVEDGGRVDDPASIIVVVGTYLLGPLHRCL
jgi:UDP-N-acetylmuramyl tripeptide synthase